MPPKGILSTAKKVVDNMFSIIKILIRFIPLIITILKVVNTQQKKTQKTSKGRKKIKAKRRK